MTSCECRLSICIPTYNRASILHGTLSQLTNLASYRRHTDIEIVISDNCSSDETEIVAREFVESGNGRVRYYKNEENVNDRNFEMVLRRGRGVFLKLTNDTFRYTDDGLEFIYQTVCDNENRKPVLFFRVKDGNEKDHRNCSTMDDFISAMSYLSTWTACYGIWREHLSQMPDFSRRASLRLAQVDALLYEFRIPGNAVCCFYSFGHAAEPKVKGGYNLLEVFGKNYAAILKSYLGAGGLSQHVFKREKFRMLYSYIIPWVVFPPANNFCFRSGYVKYLVRDYSCFWTYWIVMPVVLLARFVRLKREYANGVKRFMDGLVTIKHLFKSRHSEFHASSAS